MDGTVVCGPKYQLLTIIQDLGNIIKILNESLSRDLAQKIHNDDHLFATKTRNLRLDSFFKVEFCFKCSCSKDLWLHRTAMMQLIADFGLTVSFLAPQLRGQGLQPCSYVLKRICYYTFLKLTQSCWANQKSLKSSALDLSASATPISAVLLCSPTALTDQQVLASCGQCQPASISISGIKNQ